MALIGVQELSRQLQARDERIEQMELQLAQLQAMIETLLAEKNGADDASTELVSGK